MNLKLAFSTCPNDTFIFDALVNHKIDTQGLTFDLILADVEELNRAAFENQVDITKLSYYAFAFVSSNYTLLDSGSALGNNNGPLLISKYKIYPDEVEDLNIAIPGKHTTANLLLSIAYPKALYKKEYIFSDIEEVVLSSEMDAGLIIHESRFTYEKKGLMKIIDLGEYWETKTKLPIPLGGIVVNKKLNRDIQLKINKLVKESIEFAHKNPDSSLSFIKKYAQEMDTEVMQKHINLYVNEFSFDLGEVGKKAINTLYKESLLVPGFPKLEDQIFL